MKSLRTLLAGIIGSAMIVSVMAEDDRPQRPDPSVIKDQISAQLKERIAAAIAKAKEIREKNQERRQERRKDLKERLGDRLGQVIKNDPKLTDLRNDFQANRDQFMDIYKQLLENLKTAQEAEEGVDAAKEVISASRQGWREFKRDSRVVIVERLQAIKQEVKNKRDEQLDEAAEDARDDQEESQE